ncbi:hypothetical protein [Sphingobacterium sp. CZ-UAM]|uniref:hypothetical protein n=1 Tax=Sphingobacterium sp. CZ-UAM TaxID=1933868 RepID=UPI003977F55D
MEDILELPKDLFIQIHHLYIINQNFIEKIETNKLIVSNIELPIGTSFFFES